MPKLWKIRAMFSNWIGKLVGLVMLVALLFGVFYLLKNALPVWHMIEDLMDWRP